MAWLAAPEEPVEKAVEEAHPGSPQYEAGPVQPGSRPGRLQPADAVVGDAAEVEIAPVLAHRGDHRMVLAAESHSVSSTSPVSSKRTTQPMLMFGNSHSSARHAARHAAAEGGHPHRQIERRGPHPHERHPVGPIGGAVDVVGITRKVADDHFDLPAFGPAEPVPADPAAPGFGKQNDWPSWAMQMPLGKIRLRIDRPGRAGLRIVADDTAVAAALERIDRPVVHLVADCRFREVDAVRPARCRDRRPAAAGKSSTTENRERLVSSVSLVISRSRRDAVEAHAGDADEQLPSWSKAMPSGRPPTWAKTSCRL